MCTKPNVKILCIIYYGYVETLREFDVLYDR